MAPVSKRTLRDHLYLKMILSLWTLIKKRATMKGSLKFNPKSHRCIKPSCVMQSKPHEATISMKLMSPMSVVNLADSLRTSYGPWNQH